MEQWDAINNNVSSMSFDDIIERIPYKKEEDKKRIEIRNEATMIYRHNFFFKSIYHISRAEGQTQALFLGMSIIRNLDDSKKLVSIGTTANIELTDSELEYVKKHKTFNLLTNSYIGRDKILTYQWVQEEIGTYADILGLHIDELSTICYLMAVSRASAMPEKFKKDIDAEIDNFLRYIHDRVVFVENVIASRNNETTDGSKHEVGTWVHGYVCTHNVVGKYNSNRKEREQNLVVKEKDTSTNPEVLTPVTSKISIGLKENHMKYKPKDCTNEFTRDETRPW